MIEVQRWGDKEWVAKINGRRIGSPLPSKEAALALYEWLNGLEPFDALCLTESIADDFGWRDRYEEW